MKQEAIHEAVDRYIIKSLNDDWIISYMQLNLNFKIKNFTRVLTKDSVDIDKMLELNFDDISPIRTRYGVTYIKHCKKRIKDLDWIRDNKFKFKGLSNTQIFKLIKLKEKLSFENSYSLPF
jgi:hypothetical protein